MAEMPGISPHVARFGRWVRDAGFTVYLPSLFGRDGAHPQAEEGRRIVQRACVSAEFRAFAAGASSPVCSWLRALAREAHAACGGPGVGAVGMCFTGNFALRTFEHVVACPHSVVTAHLIDEAGEPTLTARDEIIALFAARLRPQQQGAVAARTPC